MYKFISIEAIAANALIELYERKGIIKVGFETLVHYGECIRKEIELNSEDEVILLMDRRYQINMAEVYGRFFDVDLSHYNAIFYINASGRRIDDIVKELKDHFRWTMGIGVLKAFTSEKALSVLGV